MQMKERLRKQEEAEIARRMQAQQRLREVSIENNQKGISVVQSMREEKERQQSLEKERMMGEVMQKREAENRKAELQRLKREMASIQNASYQV